MAAFPPGFNTRGSFSRNWYSTSNSLLTSMRSAWKVRWQAFEPRLSAPFGAERPGRFPPSQPAGGWCLWSNQTFSVSRLPQQWRRRRGSSAFSTSMAASSSRSSSRRRCAAVTPSVGFRRRSSGPSCLKVNPPCRVVNLHGGNTQICQDKIEQNARRHLIQLRKIHLSDGENLGPYPACSRR